MTASAVSLIEALHRLGIHRATGVPCGTLAGLWELYERSGQLTPAADEGAALAIAAGWQMAGQPGVVLCQNSGFGNLLNPLTSLVMPYQIPVFVLMTLRGWPASDDDEQQHAVMGPATEGLLQTLKVPYAILSDGTATNVRGIPLELVVDQANFALDQGRPFFALIPSGGLGDHSPGENLRREPSDAGDSITRATAVACLMEQLGDALLVSSTGYLSREAHHRLDRDRNFYMQGSMGHAAAIGLGLAQVRSDRRVVVLDGDGAFLMHLGTSSMLGGLGLSNLVHVVMDNGCYESTGAQRTLTGHLDWPLLGQGLGYNEVFYESAFSNLGRTIELAFSAVGPVLCVLRLRPTPLETHPRASDSVALPQVARRLRGSLFSSTSALGVTY